MSEKTRAAVLVAPREFEMREFDLPEIPDNAALLKVEACGICGSDIHGSERLRDGPKILGHENVGIIARIGKQAAEKWRVQEGDRVALEEYVPCGACKWCRSEDFRFCEATDIAGLVLVIPLSPVPTLVSCATSPVASVTRYRLAMPSRSEMK